MTAPDIKTRTGLTRKIVEEISRRKNEPEWMLEKRLRAFELFRKAPLPKWGPDLSKLDLRRLRYFVPAGAAEAAAWKDVPPAIRRDFEKLGIPEAERHHLSGAGAQFDSDVIYHRLKAEWQAQGVIFENMDVAVREHPELVRRHFMTECVPISDHKFAMLHAAVWSGGTFIYVPPCVRVSQPLQAYFRLAARRAGQFEHTLIIAGEGSEMDYIEGCSAPRYQEASLHAGCVEIFVGRGATVRYSSVENWSRNVYNLNTKRALVDAGGRIEWLSGNFGSGKTMLYPMSVLRGEGASAESFGVVFAGKGQELDVGGKVVHAAPRTTSVSRSRSLSRAGGRAAYRGLVRVTAAAPGSLASVVCDSLVLDRTSRAASYPTIRSASPESDISHEATIGRIGDEEIFYLMSRGLAEDQARRAVVGGFIEPIVRRLPLEYAVELQRLAEMEMERRG